jgi:hypothetical protein
MLWPLTCPVPARKPYLDPTKRRTRSLRLSIHNRAELDQGWGCQTAAQQLPNTEPGGGHLLQSNACVCRYGLLRADP